MDSLAPLAPLSASNRGPLVIVATYICLTVSLLAVAVKIWTRLSNATRLLATDWVAIAGSVNMIENGADEYPDTDEASGFRGRAGRCFDFVR
jgi:hypothetical protein